MKQKFKKAKQITALSMAGALLLQPLHGYASINFNEANNNVATEVSLADSDVITNRIDSTHVEYVYGQTKYLLDEETLSLTIDTPNISITELSIILGDDILKSIKKIIIPDGVTSIDGRAFSGCTSLTDITIPNGVTSIGYSAFSYCTSLTDVTIPNSVTSIDASAFSDCTSLTDVTIPNSVTSISGYVFYGCESLTSITIPDGVTSINNYVFYGCTSLTDITIPNSVTHIGDVAFYGCKSLTDITIPNSVTSIGRAAFSGCTSLTDITIPNGVTSIGVNTFYGCTSLTDITIPSSVTSIGERAFSGCTSLTNIHVKSAETKKLVEKAGYTAILLEEQTTTFEDETTSKEDETTTAAKETTSTLEETTIESETTTAADETTSTIEEETSTLEETTSKEDETTTAEVEETTIESETTTAAEETTSTIEEVTTSLEETTIESETTTAAEETTSTIEEETTTKPEKETTTKEPETQKPEKVTYKFSATTKAMTTGKKFVTSVVPSSDKDFDKDFVQWYSSNTKVLTVSDGTIKAVGNGTATISAKYNDTELKMTIKVTTPSTKVSLNKTKATMTEGETLKLAASLTPAKSTDSVKWSSGNNKVATVDKNGVVTAKKAGYASIVATTSSGQEKSCKITVKGMPTKITLKKKKLTVKVGNKVKIGYTLKYADSKLKAPCKVTFTSVNKKVATVDKNGYVKGVSKGFVNIAVLTQNDKMVVCRIQVTRV